MSIFSMEPQPRSPHAGAEVNVHFVSPATALPNGHGHLHTDLVESGESNVYLDTNSRQIFAGRSDDDEAGMIVAFKDLEYIVKNSVNRREKINILHRLSGLIHPGHMTALMGPSGSGKTTLLDILAGRKTVGEIRGSVSFAGHKPSQQFLRRYTGYVEQFDTLYDNLTVHEMLMYTAEMKNPQAQPLSTKKAKVEEVLEQLALLSCRDVYIGSALNRGISGGQAKRVNIGIALVTNTRVLFLDEPTSGLDSYTANEVMTVVKGLLKSGMTICATIHSPTPFCFGLFDRMMILLRGHLVYSGSNGYDAIEFFEATNPEVPRFGCAVGIADNMAEWIVDLTTKADRDGRSHEFADKFAGSALAVRNHKDLDRQLETNGTLSLAMQKELAAKRDTSTSAWFGWYTILRYRFVRDFTDHQYLGPRMGDKVLLGLIIMSLYWHAGKATASTTPGGGTQALLDRAISAINIGAVLFMISILPGFAATTYIPALVLERPIYYRERSDGMYRSITYLLARMTEELIAAFMSSMVFSLLVFFPLKLQGSFALFFCVYYLTTCIGIVLAYLIAALSPTMDVANAALPAYVVTLLFVGLLIRADSQPRYWHWYSYIDFLHYSWSAHMQNQFSHNNIPIIFGIKVLNFYSLEGDSKWQQFGYEFVFFVVFFLMAWAALSFVKHQKR